MPEIKPEQHGTRTGYVYGCRCDDCKAALAAYMREYHRRPEVKEKRREYYRRPEVKEKQRAYMREYMREYRQRPEVKEKAREYQQRPEVKTANATSTRASNLRRYGAEYSPQFIDYIESNDHLGTSIEWSDVL